MSSSYRWAWLLQDQPPDPIPTTISHSASVTGWTDSRELFTRTMSCNPGVSLISYSENSVSAFRSTMNQMGLSGMLFG